MTKDKRTKADLLAEISALNSDLDLLEKKLEEGGETRVRELEDLLILWQGRAAATRALGSHAARRADRLNSMVDLMLKRDAELTLPSQKVLAALGSQASKLAGGKKIVCICCPSCSRIALMESTDLGNGFRLCDECADKPENWTDAWGIRWKRIDGKFTGVTWSRFEWALAGGDKED